MNTSQKSIVVINDHQLITGLLEHYVKEFGFGEIEAYTDTESTLDKIFSDPPDLLIIDKMLPVSHAGNGGKTDITDPYILMDSHTAFRVVRQVRAKCPDTRILILTEERHPHPFCLGFEAGAHGIASKLDTLTTFVKILEEVMGGKTRVTSTRMRELIEKYSQSPIPYLNSFEIQILELAQEGLESPEIGKKLGYSAKTIRNTVSKINEKMGTRNRYKAIQKAVDMGLVGWHTVEDGN
jgi:DNA-binding NarL/FixJ family response regulator